MSKPDLDAIEWRERRATQGPWECDGFADGDIVNLALFEGNNQGRVIAGGIETHADADFLLNAHTDVPALLAYARDLEARIAKVHDYAEIALTCEEGCTDLATEVLFALTATDAP